MLIEQPVLAVENNGKGRTEAEGVVNRVEYLPFRKDRRAAEYDHTA